MSYHSKVVTNKGLYSIWESGGKLVLLSGKLCFIIKESTYDNQFQVVSLYFLLLSISKLRLLFLLSSSFTHESWAAALEQKELKLPRHRFSPIKPCINASTRKAINQTFDMDCIPQGWYIYKLASIYIIVKFHIVLVYCVAFLLYYCIKWGTKSQSLCTGSTEIETCKHHALQVLPRCRRNYSNQSK